MADDPNETIRSLVESWCDRREYHALSIVLSAWLANNGPTDGWENLRDGLRHAYAICTHLPQTERDALKKAYVDIDYALRNR
jgi:hypothetical protein